MRRKVLFSQFRRDLGTYARLLGIGLPLTMALGTAAAMVVLGFDPWAALLVGAALAPTDAALGATVMSDPRVPGKVRSASTSRADSTTASPPRSCMVAIAGVAASEGVAGVEGPGRAVVGCSSGVLVGVVVGGLGGAVSRRARERGWLSEELAGPAGPGPGAGRLHRSVAGRRQRLRGRVRRRPGLRQCRGPRRREGGLLRRAAGPWRR